MCGAALTANAEVDAMFQKALHFYTFLTSQSVLHRRTNY
jgi:hypothetical protein